VLGSSSRRQRVDVSQVLQHELPMGYTTSAAGREDEKTVENVIVLALEQAPVPPKAPRWHG